MSMTTDFPAFGIDADSSQGDEALENFRILAGVYATQTRLMSELKVLARRRARAVRQREAFGAISVVVDAVISQIDARRAEVLEGLKANRALAGSNC